SGVRVPSRITQRSSSEEVRGRTDQGQMDCRGGWHLRMTCEKCCLKRLEGRKPVKHLSRLFVRTKTQVNECFPVVFHKDAILEISPVQGSEFLHHPANMLLVLCRVCCLHDIPIGGNDHLEYSSVLMDKAVLLCYTR